MPGDRGDRTENAGTGLPAPVVGRHEALGPGDLYVVRKGSTTERGTHWDMFLVVSSVGDVLTMLWHHGARSEWTCESYLYEEIGGRDWLSDFDRVNAQ